MCRAHDHRSPLSAAIHTASLWHRMPVRGMKTIFKNLCYNTDQVCFAKTMSPAPVFVRIPGSHHPGTRLRLVPGFRDPGSVLILGQVTQYGNPYLICIPQIARFIGANMGPTWVLSAPDVPPCWPHKPCFQGPVPLVSWLVTYWLSLWSTCIKPSWVHSHYQSLL